MKRLVLLICILAFVGIAAYWYLVIYHEPPLNSDTVAIVNRYPIKVSDFEDRLNKIKMHYTPDKEINLSEIKNTILRRMIIEAFINQEARDKNIKVTDEALKRYIDNIKQSYSKEEFNQLLFNQFKTYDDWTSELKQKLLIEKTLSKIIIEKIDVSEKELKAYFQNFYSEKINEPKIKLAQIFTHTREDAEKALEEINAGVIPFEEIARKYSKSPEAQHGGIIGLISKGEGIELFDLAFSMKPNEISEILQSDYGFHILKVVEYIQPSKVTFAQVKPFILNEIIQNKENILYEKWLSKKFKNSKIIKNTALIDRVR